jgi:hypothetical protein
MLLAMMALAYLKAKSTEGEKRAAFSQQSTTQIRVKLRMLQPDFTIL